MSTEILFYAEMARIIRLWDDWLADLLQNATGPKSIQDDIEHISQLNPQQRESIRRLARAVLQNGLSSLMSSLDGNSDMADNVLLSLVDSDGNLLSEDLLNGFVGYLMDHDEYM